MNDSVLDILIFLFDNFMDVEDAPPPEETTLLPEETLTPLPSMYALPGGAEVSIRRR